jgi:protein-disulfide isomerase
MAAPQQTRKERREQARSARLEAERHEAAASARRRRLIQLGGVLGLAVVVVIVAIVLSSNGAKPAARAPGEAIAGQNLAAAEFAGIPQSGSVLGNPKATHTLVEYGDLICPACKAYSDDIIPSVVQSYVRTGKLRFEFRPFGFIRDWSAQAAQYAWAAGLQNKQFNFSKLWYTNQLDEDDNYVSDAFARKIAAGVPGLDADKMIADASSAQVKASVADTQRAFTTLGFNATPSFAAGTTGGTLRPFDLGGSVASAKAALDKLIGASST